MSHIDDDAISNYSNNRSFEEVVEARVTRRSLMGGGMVLAATSALSGVSALLRSVPASAHHTGPLLGFAGIPVSSTDAVVVPEGYTAKVLIAWGDPIANGPGFNSDASNTSTDQEQQWGMHNDGLVYFPIDGSAHGLIVQNHEYTDDVLLFTDGTASWNAEKTRKSQAAHGVSVLEIKRRERRGDVSWEIVRRSKYARRITAFTPMRIEGPAAGDSRLMTSADPTGRRVLGTINNCAMGYTPWKTYLACEENFNGYFRKTGAQTPLEARYGINASGAGYLWHTTDTRFSADAEPNEAHRFGWVTEIDPFDRSSAPRKRTALGRFKHEGAWVQEARDGRVVIYSGDDEQFEYIYRYVSRLPWKKSFKNGIHPLDDGTLYVARFHEDGSGEWLPLTPANPALAGWSMADILINTRGAADLAGATKMDRPEWIDTFPDQLMAIATLTNNSRRGVGTNPGVNAMNPRSPNTFGHVIRWSYGSDFTEDSFGWDIFALAGDPAVAANGSTIIGDKYGSPDGIYVAPSGRLWIQTDVSGSTINAGAYAGFGNNQMLCADPWTKETRRFLVGPNVCEVTGVMVTPDERTMFVGIQHPGEAPSGVNDPLDPKRYSSWPDGPTGGRPRSSLVVITKDDGGKIGS